METDINFNSCRYENELELQKKVGYLLKNVDNLPQFLRELFSFFDADEIGNIGVIIDILERYFCIEGNSVDVLSRICFENVSKTPSNLVPLLDNLCRIKALANALIKKNICVKLKDLLKGKNIVHFLICENLTDQYNLFEILKIDETKWVPEKDIPYTVCSQKQQIFYYLILRKVHDSIVSKRRDLKIKELMEQIDDLTVYISLIDDIFKLLFIRHSQVSEAPLRQTSVRDLNAACKVETDISNKTCEKNKFICTGSELKGILKELKESIIKKNCYCKDRDIQDESEKLGKYVVHINEALYKLNFWAKLKHLSKSISSIENLTLIVQNHNTTADKSSSDDDGSNLSKQPNSKRKSKFKKRPSLWGSEKSGLTGKITETNSLISMLLCNFSTIAEYAFAFGNFEDTKNINNIYKIDNTEVKNGIIFSDKMKIYTRKMQLILKTLKREETDNLQRDSIVERIRNVAAVGFEASSVINIIEQFIDSVEVKMLQNHNNELLKKTIKSDNLYLEQYVSKNLKLTTILDLISNADFEIEICENIINIINRNGSFSDATLYGRVGYFSFLQSITESMRIFKSIIRNNYSSSLQKFLINSFSYDTPKLQTELYNILKFNEIYGKNIKEVEDIKNLENKFAKTNPKTNFFMRMKIFLQNFISLIRVTDKNCEYDIDQTLAITPHRVIADIIFNQDISFSELEKNIFLLNLHLVHTIIELILPDFVKEESYCKINKLDFIDNVSPSSIWKYISLKSPFLGQFLYHGILHELNFENSTENILQVNPTFLSKITKLDIVTNLSILQNINLLPTALLLDYVDEEVLNLKNSVSLKYLICSGLREKKGTEFMLRRNDFALKLIFSDIKHISLLKSIRGITQRYILLIENYERVDDCILLQEMLNTILFDQNSIQIYKIDNTEVKNGIIFSDKMKIYTRKMQLILKTLKREETDNLQRDSIVERIRNVAAVGFEASSVINIIEQFIDSVEVKMLQNHNNELLKKTIKSDNLYLEQYVSKNLKLTTILDLISNADFEIEICENIINIINRNGSFSDATLYGRVGYFSFLQSITESMRIFKSIIRNNYSSSLQKFLINSFSYDTPKLQTELYNILKFNEIYGKNIKEVEDIKNLENKFAKTNPKTNFFMRMKIFLQNFISLIRVTDKNCEYDIDQTLAITPHRVIADIIFNQDISFSELEKNIFLLNLHLVHTIIELILPDFVKEESYCKINKLDFIDNVSPSSIWKYISLKSPFLGQFLYHGILHELNFENSTENILQVNPTFLSKITKLDIVTNLSILQNINLLPTALLLDYVDEEVLNLKNSVSLKYLICSGLREKKGTEFMLRRNDFALKLIFSDIKHISLLKSIRGITQRYILLIENYERVDDCILLQEMLNTILFDQNSIQVDIMLIEKIKFIKREVEVYSKICNVVNLKSWREAYENSKSRPTKIFELLISNNEFELLNEWAKINGIYRNGTNEQLTYVDLNNLITADEKLLANLLEVVEKYPINYVNLLIRMNYDKSRAAKSFFSIIECLTKNCEKNFDNCKISLKILRIMKTNNLQVDWSMLEKPLVLIEQLIMNSKFQLLSKVLHEIDTIVPQQPCKYCVEIGNRYYGVSRSSSYETNSELRTNSDFILFNFNLHKNDHILTTSCIELLLRIYASKALDFQISNKSKIFYESISISNDVISIDSLASTFMMPKVPPTKHEWIKDEDANICQSCHYTVFTMLIRRHHCRRCGRVVCYSCSKHRMKIPELYQDVHVRICIDCARELQIKDDRTTERKHLIENIEKYDNCENLLKWELNGNLTHDRMLREQFCYEHACDVALCLTILSYHKNKEKCISLLLYHCKKLEMLLAFNNPEVNFNSIAKILSCLSLAAKIRGGPSECDAIREQADIIKSFARNGCETLMIPDSFNKNNIKKLIYNLVDAERYFLALDIALKRGVSKSEVLAAHGLSYLKSGCWELAREKFTHCMTRMCSFTDGALIFEAIMSTSDLNKYNSRILRRPKRSPPLLSEIIRVLESTSNILILSERCKETSSLHSSTISISSVQFSSASKQNIRINENAFIIFNTLSSLKALSNIINFEEYDKHIVNYKSKIFNECFYYLVTYGSHTDIFNFLIRYKQTKAALRYFVFQHFKSEYFISNIFLHFLKAGEVAILVDHMLDLEQYLLIWKNIFTCICRYLESKGLFNSLYQLQILLKDLVRASMTCVRFYLRRCITFKQLNDNLFHLENAQKHLETEIELCQNWENINFDKIPNKIVESSFPMQLDYKTLNTHLNTILLQKEVTKFLTKSEEEHSPTLEKLLRIQNSTRKTLPSLFGSVEEKIEITVLIMLCGRNLEEGFGLSFRIIQEFKLTPIKIYVTATQFLAKNNQLEEILKLCDCIIGNNDFEESVKEVDELVLEAIKCYIKVPDITSKYKRLIKLIKNIETQVSCYIYLEQLETAYVIADQNNMFDQIKKILNKAKEIKRVDIKNLCEKKLKMIT